MSRENVSKCTKSYSSLFCFLGENNQDENGQGGDNPGSSGAAGGPGGASGGQTETAGSDSASVSSDRDVTMPTLESLEPDSNG